MTELEKRLDWMQAKANNLEEPGRRVLAEILIEIARQLGRVADVLEATQF